MLAHTRTGSGEPLILLHGITHRRQAWDLVTPRLAQEREVIAVDLPGHGESPDLTEEFRGDANALADAVEEFIAELGLERPHVAGNSLGGLIALELAARGTVRSATALSPAGYWSSAGRIWARFVLGGASAVLQRLPRRATEAVLHTAAGRAALVGLIVAHPTRQDPETLIGDLAGLVDPKPSFHTMISAFDTWTLPARAMVPTTVGWGSRDLLLPTLQMKRLQETLPDARVYVLPGCGHVPMGDDPELVADLLLAGSRPRSG